MHLHQKYYFSGIINDPSKTELMFIGGPLKSSIGIAVVRISDLFLSILYDFKCST